MSHPKRRLHKKRPLLRNPHRSSRKPCRERPSKALPLLSPFNLALRTTIVDAEADVDEATRIQVRASTDLANSPSGLSGMVGTVFTYQRFNLRAGIGYGTWFLPWVDLPVGQDTVSGDLDVYWRF